MLLVMKLMVLKELKETIENNLQTDIKLGKAQISKIIKSGDF